VSIENELVHWSLDDHFREGATTICELLSCEGLEKSDPRVCFHLTPIEWNEDEQWGEQAAYNRLAKPLFDALPIALDVDYVGGTIGIEAWETAVPSIEWLHARIPALVDIAIRSGLMFAGWSFEPLQPGDFSFVSCGPHFDVVNASTPAGRAAIEELTQELIGAAEVKKS
jgi:hypothetical protein